MTRNWRPGDVAVRDPEPGISRYGFYVEKNNTCPVAHPRGGHFHTSMGKWDSVRTETVNPWRPALILDPESREDRLALYNGSMVSTTDHLFPRTHDRIQRRMLDEIARRSPPNTCPESIKVGAFTYHCTAEMPHGVGGHVIDTKVVW